jgi:hypothetical protein
MSQFRACLVEDTFVAAREAAVDVDSLELIGAPRHVVLCVRWPEIVESEWEFGRITRIGDFVEREAALAAAGLGEDRG